jgi:hypothetical protein
MSDSLTRPQLRTPRAAAIAGIVFSLLLSASVVLVSLANQSEVGTPLATPFAKQALILGLNLVPLAGIAFLWFIGVVRDRIGQYEDRFFATVFLGSGLLFLAMLFATAAIGGSIVASSLPSSDPLITFGRQVVHDIMNVYAMKMAGVFMISTSTILLRTVVLSRWLAYIGYAFALVQLVTLTYWEWITLLFPLWILALSIELLLTSLRESHQLGET